MMSLLYVQLTSLRRRVQSHDWSCARRTRGLSYEPFNALYQKLSLGAKLLQGIQQVDILSTDMAD